MSRRRDNPGHSGTDPSVLSRAQTVVLALLSSGRSITSAARQARVSRRTVHRWLALPAFQKAVAEAARQVVADATSELKGLSLAAVDALRGVIVDPSAPAAARTRAAQLVLMATGVLPREPAPAPPPVPPLQDPEVIDRARERLRLLHEEMEERRREYRERDAFFRGGPPPPGPNGSG